MAGENCLMAATGFAGTSAMPGGIAAFKAQKVGFGVQMDYSETETRVQKTIYFTASMDDSFVITLIFSSWDDYTNAANWFQVYSNSIADPHDTTINPLSVVVMNPMTNEIIFSGVGIPTSGVTFGDSVGELTYVMELGFQGAYQQLNTASSYQQADFHGQAQYFYPSGTQNGSATAAQEDLVYNAAPNTGSLSNSPIKVGTTSNPSQSGNRISQ